MSFGLENQMMHPVRRWLQRQGLLVKPEFTLPWGVCDLVGLSFDKSRVAKRLSYRQYRPIGPMQRVELLSHIPDIESKAGITFAELQNLGTTASFGSSLERDLRTLIANRFVVAGRNDCYQKVNGWAPLHSRIVAVELKLSRISEALSQALSNRYFAPESYVALPAEVAERLVCSNRLSEFNENGIGILAVTRTICRVLLSPTQTVAPDATLQTHCVERFWRTRDNSSSTAVPRVRAS